MGTSKGKYSNNIATPLTIESLKNAMKILQKPKVNLLQPVFIFPPDIIEDVKFLMFAKPIKEIGNYALYKYKERKEWGRGICKSLGDFSYKHYSCPLRVIGEYTDYYLSTRAMKKRGYPEMMYWEELPEQIKRYYRGR